jgi:hypothetical protein
MLDILGDYLNLRKIVFSRLDGSMNYLDRQVDIKLVSILNGGVSRDFVQIFERLRFYFKKFKQFLAVNAKITPKAYVYGHASIFPTIINQMLSIITLWQR